MDWSECLALLLVSIGATIALTPLAKRLALRFDAIDYPSTRRVNKEPTPRMGGVAIFGGMVVSCIVLAIGIQAFGWENPFQPVLGRPINYPMLAIGMIFMFAVGLVDDIKNLSAKVKFLGQIISACIIAASGLLLTEVQNPFQPGFIEFGWVAYPITIFYLVAFANIINLIDGLDGLASGISAISAATIFVFAVLSTRFEVAAFSIIVVGVCLGFLWFNHHPASIFMGDSGSLLLGLTLGVVSLLAVARTALFVSLLVPIITAGVPITDTAVAIIRRKRAHQRVDSPDKGHIHHKLMNAGFSQNATVLIMWTWSAALAVCSIIIVEFDGIARVISIVIAIAITAFAIVKLRLFDPVLQHYYNPREKKNKLKDKIRK